ncbi:hypothetical protein [Oceanobacillus timonensis]|uniref:hypothetical protein n=1 Tax=Oceanobacillus timonensis TaxID=1926285 RepID=UPI0009BB28B8|nr:hypothetical protein [Oceanobacillus timonensis]
MTGNELLKKLKNEFNLNYFGESESSGKFYFEKIGQGEWYVEISPKEKRVRFPEINSLLSQDEQVEIWNEYVEIFYLLINYSGCWWELGMGTPLNIKYKFKSYKSVDYTDSIAKFTVFYK